MLNTKKHTAILLFANTSEEEVKQKGIVKGNSLFQYLNRKTYLEAEKTGLDVIVFSEKLQKGNSFSERFSNAIESAFLQGYQHIISIGNDSPDLKAKHIAIAHENLNKGITTLGPSLDGGAYLITISKQQFNKKNFTSLPWQSRVLFTSLKKYLEHKNGIVQQIEILKDIDTITDLYYFTSRFKHINLAFRKLILNILFFTRKTTSIISCFNKQNYFSLFYNKGSPLVI